MLYLAATEFPSDEFTGRVLLSFVGLVILVICLGVAIYNFATWGWSSEHLIVKVAAALVSVVITVVGGGFGLFVIIASIWGTAVPAS